jgi:nickel-dependent lactate racemase
MEIKLAYGQKGLTLSVPDAWNVTVIEPRFLPAIAHVEKRLQKELQNPINHMPLSQWVKPTDRVGIVFNDITRPTPNALLIHALLQELSHVPRKNILLFNALGTHRRNSDEELREILDRELVETFRIIQNNAFDPVQQQLLGLTSGGAVVRLHRELMACDVKIVTGFIEPHFFAGFSGGGKALMPGMADIQTIFQNHNAKKIGHPKSTWGILKSNPIHEEIQEAALLAGKLFLCNVTLNRNKEITNIFCGDLLAAHNRGCTFVKEHAMQEVDQPFDIVVTTNSGYPLDQNLYQAVKGMSAAAPVTAKNGTIIIAAECRDGLPDHGLYGKLLHEATSPAALLQTIESSNECLQDQWQVQIQARIQLHADVYVYSDNLDNHQLQAAMVKPCRDIVQTIEECLFRYGKEAHICVLPQGPQTIPYLRKKKNKEKDTKMKD